MMMVVEDLIMIQKDDDDVDNDEDEDEDATHPTTRSDKTSRNESSSTGAPLQRLVVQYSL